MNKIKIYTINFTNGKMEQTGNTEYYMKTKKAKDFLLSHGYVEVSAEDFSVNTRGQWRRPSTYFFSESFAYLGFIEANT